MKSRIKQYFNHSKGELRGLYVLVFLIVIVFAIPVISNHFVKSKAVDFSEFDTIIKSLEQNIEDNSVNDPETRLISYFNFDPNTISIDKLHDLGFSKKQAQTLSNYRKSGGKFFKKEDLLKVYSIDKEMFENLKPFIQIENIKTDVVEKSGTNRYEKPNDNQKSLEGKEFIIVEINAADTIELMRISGIGPVLARRIQSYRASLGGFAHPEQLLEVYGVDTSLFMRISANILVNPELIQKINLNTVDFKTLNQHPYISYSDTKAIFKFRQLMGNFILLDELTQNNLVNEETYKKIMPYLKIE